MKQVVRKETGNEHQVQCRSLGALLEASESRCAILYGSAVGLDVLHFGQLTTVRGDFLEPGHDLCP